MYVGSVGAGGDGYAAGDVADVGVVACTPLSIMAIRTCEMGRAEVVVSLWVSWI